MKNLTVRAFVLALAVTGAVATSVTSAAAKTHKIATAAFTEPTSPAPLCKPNSGNTCGITDND